ncbi:tyrosine-type recombinase/integrase [Haloferax sp. YSSS75]|uniref:tyrosine-type recombinase/integrase n=1 Tax=Haloferax sp. YSSS75 TaxID=3388564 RepID=UPI00398CE390
MNHNLGTVCGHLYCLTNFLAFLTKEDPTILRLQIVASLDEQPSSDIRSVGARFAPSFGSLDGPIRDFRHSAQSLVRYLREREFGTRKHAFVELLCDTKARPGQIRELDRSELNLQEKTVSVGISNSYIVSSVGLLNQRTAELSEGTVDALRTYIEHERKAVPDTKPAPLFTTSHGRVSAAALRQSFKVASEAANDYSHFRKRQDSGLHDEQLSGRRVQIFTPTDVWHSVISSTLDSE